MAIIINKQIYANGQTYMASFLAAWPPISATKWHRSRKLFPVTARPQRSCGTAWPSTLPVCLISFISQIRSIGLSPDN